MTGIFSRHFWRLLCFWCIFLAGAAGAAFAAEGKTTIADTIYRADGTAASGTVIISWQSFTTGDGRAVAAGSLSQAIGERGAFSIDLYPTPAGVYYKVVLKLADGTTSTEYWSVPAVAMTTIQTIRSKVVPLNLAAQFVSRSELVGRALDSAVVHNSGDEQINGKKTFGQSPAVPTPYAVSDATPKSYVDMAVSKAPYRDSFNVEAFGAVCDGEANDAAAIESAIAAATATGGIVRLPANKTCSFSTPLIVRSGYWALIGDSGAKLKFTGSGVAFTIDGSGIGNGAGNVLLENFAIDAGANGSTCLYTKKLTRSKVSNLECRGATGTAFVADFSVSVLYEHLVASSNNGPFTARPSRGILVTNAAGAASSDNTFVNPILEGINGDGIEVHASNANVFIGGTSEGNAGRGIFISGTSVSNTFINMDIEANTGSHDVELRDGDTIRGTQFVNMTVARDLMIGTNSKETLITTGNYKTVTINAGALATTLIGVRYDVLADGGTLTNRLGENATNSNTLGTTTLNGAATFNVAPLLSNNIPLSGKISGGAAINLLWLTATDQTLVQYLAGKAFKVRDHNGNDKLQVDDTATTVKGNLVVASSGTATMSIDALTGRGSFNGGVLMTDAALCRNSAGVLNTVAGTVCSATPSGGFKTVQFTLASGTAPTCDATTRGQINYTAGGTGAKDVMQVCAKDAANAYGWRPIY